MLFGGAPSNLRWTGAFESKMPYLPNADLSDSIILCINITLHIHAIFTNIKINGTILWMCLWTVLEINQSGHLQTTHNTRALHSTETAMNRVISDMLTVVDSRVAVTRQQHGIWHPWPQSPSSTCQRSFQFQWHGLGLAAFIPFGERTVRSEQLPIFIC